MSYSLTHRALPRRSLRGLGTDTSGFDCTELAVTKIKAIDDVAVDCCSAVKKSKSSDGEKLRKMGECAAQAAGATAGAAACLAAGSVTFGLTALAAPLCGTIGGAVGKVIFNRVSGYSTAQLAAGGIAAVSCGAAGPICFMIAAELTGWISDAVGPIIDGIFSPGAARERDLVLTKSRNAAWALADKSIHEMEDNVRREWMNTILRLKALYESMVNVVDTGRSTELRWDSSLKGLGFDATYAALATQLVKADQSIMAPLMQKFALPGGAPSAGLIVETRSGMLDWLTVARDAGQPGCERYGGMPGQAPSTKMKDPYSNLCPHTIYGAYLSDPDNVLTRGGKHTKEQDTAWYRMAIPRYAERTASYLTRLLNAEVSVATVIVTYGIAKKTEMLAREAATDNVEAMVKKCQLAAASAAQAARAAARDDVTVDGARILAKVAKRRAEFAYAMARAVEAKTTTCGKGSMCQEAVSYVASATASAHAADLTVKSKEHSRLLKWGIVAALAAGGGYLLLRD